MMELTALTQKELLALALEATRRGDAAHSLAYLKEAAARDDATGEAYFLLGSEYAQIGMFDEAVSNMQRAVDLAPEFPIARFQLGLLHLTSGRADEARQALTPLSDLGDQHALAVLARGLDHLIADEFPECVRCLEHGIELNTDNPALNTDMQQLVERVKSAMASTPPTTVDAAPAEEGHLFLNVYTGRKVH
jgi:tetratricopeptide (TPR) repeat protein